MQLNCTTIPNEHKVQRNHEAISTRKFLETLYGGLEGKFIYLWALPDKITYWFKSEDIQAMSDKAINLSNEGKSVYFGLGAGDIEKKSSERLTVAEVTAIPGVWVDIDIAGIGHKSERLPGTINEAMAIVNSLPLPPSIVVASGGGLHVYYIFKEPWVLNTPEEKAEASLLVQGIQEMLRQKNPQYIIDPTHSLAQVLRPVGTSNRKDENDVKLVQAIDRSDYRYSFDDLTQHYIQKK